MNEQTDIAVRRLIEMTKAGEIEWTQHEARFYIADVDINDNTYAVRIGDFIGDYPLVVNGKQFSRGGLGSAEEDLWNIIDVDYCKHAEFLSDMGITATVQEATPCP